MKKAHDNTQTNRHQNLIPNPLACWTISFEESQYPKPNDDEQPSHDHGRPVFVEYLDEDSTNEGEWWDDQCSREHLDAGP